MPWIGRPVLVRLRLSACHAILTRSLPEVRHTREPARSSRSCFRPTHRAHRSRRRADVDVSTTQDRAPRAYLWSSRGASVASIRTCGRRRSSRHVGAAAWARTPCAEHHRGYPGCSRADRSSQNAPATQADSDDLREAAAPERDLVHRLQRAVSSRRWSYCYRSRSPTSSVGSSSAAMASGAISLRRGQRPVPRDLRRIRSSEVIALRQRSALRIDWPGGLTKLSVLAAAPRHPPRARRSRARRGYARGGRSKTSPMFPVAQGLAVLVAKRPTPSLANLGGPWSHGGTL